MSESAPGAALGLGLGVLSAARELRDYHRQILRQSPLVSWRPWEAPGEGSGLPALPPTHCTQREALLASLAPGVLVSLVVGGNRSGKTEVGRVLAVVFALGREHPAVRRWASLWSIPLDLIPSGPGRTCLVARSSADSIRYHRPQVARLMPPGQRWRNYGGRGEAHVSLGNGDVGEIVPEIWFKSAEQGRDGLQGDAFRLIDVDEEILRPDGSECFDELLMRIADQQGRIVHTFTPLAGRSWTWRRFVRSPPAGTVISRVRAVDNPHVSAAFLARIYAGLPERVVRARRDGEFVALEGSVYEEWDPGQHVADLSGEAPAALRLRALGWDATGAPPADWTVYAAGDFGYANPAVMLWGAVGPDREVVIFASWYGAGCTTAQHLSGWRAIEAGEPTDLAAGRPEEEAPLPGRPRSRGPRRAEPEASEPGGAPQASRWPLRVERRWLDPSAAEAAATYRAGEYHVSGARNDWAAGRDACHRALHCPTDGRGPRLSVLRGRAPDLERTLAAYAYPQDAPEARAEKPAASDDHAPDALRYLLLGLERYLGWGPERVGDCD